MNYKTERYIGVRNVFCKAPSFVEGIKYHEDRDNLVTALMLNENDAVLGFYYEYGSSQIKVLETETVKLISIDPAKLAFKIQHIAETFRKEQKKKNDDRSRI